MDFTWPLKFHTDACGSDLGAILYQTSEDGMDAVIAYASRSLTKAESHYPAHKLEFLTLSGLQLGSSLSICMDQPLMYTPTTTP